MRIRNTALALVFCLVTSAALTARADDKKDIAALYQKLEKAMIAKDVKGIMATGAPGFSYTENGRTMTGDAISAQMQQQFTMITGTPKAKFTIVSCDIKGKTATVISTSTSEMQIPGQDGKPQVLKSTGKSSDLLVKTDKGWLMKTIKVLSSSMTLNGKPINLNKPAGK